jgi:hypothetical protein
MAMTVKKKLVLAAAAVGGLALAAGIAMVVMIGPRNVIGMLRYDQREEGRYVVGDAAPDVGLLTLEGTPVRLAQHFGERPTVIVFGSFT